MIVKCASCQTRFKIGDDKVTEKGVKVRCTKCATVFVVRKDTLVPGLAESSLPPAPARKPATTSLDDLLGPSEGSRPPPPPPGSFQDSFRESVLAVPASEDPFAGFLPSTPAPPPPAIAGLMPGEFALPPSRPKIQLPPPPPSQPPPQASTPSADIRGFADWPLEPAGGAFGESPPEPSGEPDPFGAPPPSWPTADALADDPLFAPSGLSSPPAAPPPLKGPPAVAALPPPLSPSASSPAFGGDPFDPGLDPLGDDAAPGSFSSASSGAFGQTTVRPPPVSFGADFGSFDPLAGLSLDPAAIPAMAEPPDATSENQAPRAPAAPSFQSQDSGFALENDFDGLPAGNEHHAEAADALFVLPPKPAPSASQPPHDLGTAGTAGTPLGFGSEAEHSAPRETPAPGKARRGVAADDDSAPGEKPLSARIFSALAGAALVALALLMFVAYRNGGRLDLHDPMTSIFGAFGFSRPVAARQALPARITESGFYLTLRGEPILFVRGTITNLSGAPARVGLKLEVSAQGQVIATAEGLPGVAPTPEELFSAGVAPKAESKPDVRPPDKLEIASTTKGVARPDASKGGKGEGRAPLADAPKDAAPPDPKPKDAPESELKNDVEAIAGRLLAAGSPALGPGESQSFVLFTADVPAAARASPEPLELRVSAQALPQAELASPPPHGLTALAPAPGKK